MQLFQIPVYIGTNEGLVKEYKNDTPFQGSNGFNDVSHDRKAEINLREESASMALIQLSKEYEGQIDLLCFAPLTNIAIAMKADPKFAKRLKNIYCMGGNFEGIGNATISAEFNFLCDPEAAYVVLRNTPKPIILVPWEICEEVNFSLVSNFTVYINFNSLLCLQRNGGITFSVKLMMKELHFST